MSGSFMAIDRVQWEMIADSSALGSALSAGYPDLLVQFQISEELPVRKDSEAACKHHGFKGPMVDSRKVFALRGLSLDVIDRAKLEGSERIVDLNAPQELGEYDLVIDPGTSEHCFNIPQALVNLAGAVKVGGVMSQALPMSMFNHGYWNVNPVALLDFYEANGFQIEKMVIRHPGGVFEPKVEERGMRMKGVPDGSVVVLLARRLAKKPFEWPQQKL